MNRREFLKATAAGLTLSALGNYVTAAAEKKTYRAGLIGTGWYGKSDLWRLIQVSPVEVVSLCDVDKNLLKGAAEMAAQRQKSHKTPRTFTDYRQMLKEKDLDIVLIGSPDHWHALQMIAAVESGADVYCQKPISHDVLEGEAMVAATKKTGRVVQVGMQRRSTPHLVEAKKKIVDAGLLGKVAHADICCYYHMRMDKNPPACPVPDFLDYDAWTGPAPLLPYCELPHRGWWRAFMEYSNGIVGDMCVHMLDATRWMLGLGWPKRVSSTGGIYVQKQSRADTSDTQSATFDFGDMTVDWQHRAWGTAPDSKYPWAFTLYGDKGTLQASVMSYDFTPVGKGGQAIHGDCVYEREQFPEDVTEKDIELHVASATRAHMKDFLAAIENRGKPVASIEEGHISAASCIMANLSMKLGRTLAYDPATRQIVGDAEATKLLRGPYRTGYQHPAETLG